MSEGYIFVGALPPPIQGMANVNLKICERLQREGLLLDRHDVGLGVYHAQWTGQLRRLCMLLRAWLAVAVGAGRRRGLYIGADAGIGLYGFVVLALTARLRGAPVVVHHHSYAYVAADSQPMGWLLAAGGRRQMHVFLCADMQQRFLARYAQRLPADPASAVLSNAFLNPPVAATDARPDGEPIVLGHMSNLSRDKGTAIFLSLVETLIADDVIGSAHLAGPFGEPQMERAVQYAVANSDGRLTYWGPVAGDRKQQFFDSIDAFVFPTRYLHEAQPLVLQEALAHGRPVVTLERGCIGCDHAGSESLVVERVEDFLPAAERWVRDLQSQGRLAQARRAARDRSQADFTAANQSADHLVKVLLRERLDD